MEILINAIDTVSTSKKRKNSSIGTKSIKRAKHSNKKDIESVERTKICINPKKRENLLLSDVRPKLIFISGAIIRRFGRSNFTHISDKYRRSLIRFFSIHSIENNSFRIHYKREILGKNLYTISIKLTPNSEIPDEHKDKIYEAIGYVGSKVFKDFVLKDEEYEVRWIF